MDLLHTALSVTGLRGHWWLFPDGAGVAVVAGEMAGDFALGALRGKTACFAELNGKL